MRRLTIRFIVTFLSPPVLKATTKLHALWLARSAALVRAGAMSGTTNQLNVLARNLPHIAEAGEGLLLSVFTVYHAYFHRMHDRVQRLGNAILKTQQKPNVPLH